MTYPPSRFGKVLLELFRHGTVDVLGAGGVARYPIQKSNEVKNKQKNKIGRKQKKKH